MLLKQASYRYCGVLSFLMATCIVAAAPCLAQNNFSGQMLASSPCSLSQESDDFTECMTVIVPLSGTLLLPKRQFKTSPSTVTVTDDGQPQLILVYNRARSAPSTKIGIGF